MEADGTVLRCQNCHEELEKEWESCPACKTPTSRMKSELLCPNCQFKIKNHWKECPKCHTELSGWSTPPESSHSTSSEKIFFSGPIDNDKFGTKITIPDNEVIGEKYIIKKKLGQGGYGSVYLAQDSVLKEQIALKIVIVGEGKSEKAVEQLIHEFKLRERVNDSTHIIKAYDPRSCEYKGLSLVLLPMEFAKDGNLRTWLHKNLNKKERLNKSIEFFKQTCLGVKAIHDAGLSHLDIKPENILLLENIVKITDFGIGRFIDNQLDNPLQLMNQGIGTPQYMSPEQFKVARQKEVGHASDIYTLGLLLYEILDGNLPFDGSPEELKEKHLTLSPPILKGYNDLWWKIISKCLNKNLLDRYQSIGLLINDIDRICKGLALSTDVSCQKCNHINKNINVKYCEKCSNDLKELFHPCLVCAREVRIDIDNCPGCNAPISAQYLYLNRKKEIEILKDEDPSAAIELLEIVLRSDGGGNDDEIQLIKELRNKLDKVTPIIAEANNFYSKSELEKAINCWCKVLNFFPRHRIALQQLEALEKQLKDFTALKHNAIDCMDEGNFEEAEKFLQECMKLIPAEKDIKDLLNELNQRSHKYYLALNQANSDLKSKRLFEAKKQAAIAINYAPNSKEISRINNDISEKLDYAEKLFNKAKESISFAKFKDIEDYISKIEKTVTDKPELNRFKDTFKKTKEEYTQKMHEAREFQQSGSFKSALENLNLAKEVCPDSEEANELIQIISDAQNNVYSLLEKAKKYCNSADFVLAEDFRRDAEKLWPTFFELEVLKDKLQKTKEEYDQKMQEARAFQESGDFEKALENLKDAKELCPNSGEVNDLISIISGIKNKAIPLLENAKKYCLSAEFKLSESALNEAEKLLLQSKELIDFRKVFEKTKKEYMFALSTAEKSLSAYKFEEAREIYKKAKKICPNSKEIDKLLDKVDILDRLRFEDIQAKENKRILKIIGLIFLFIVGAVIFYKLYTALQDEKQRREVYQQEQIARQRAEEEEKKRQEELRLRQQLEEQLARQREEEERRKRDELAVRRATLEKKIDKDMKACYRYLQMGITTKNYIGSVYKERFDLWKEASEFGLPGGEYLIGRCYEEGLGVQKDYYEAVKWYKKAAKQGHTIAQYNLGNCYRNGKGVSQNYREAVYWYGLVAEQGDADAQTELGYCYEALQDYREAVKWYKKAAEQGHVIAQYNLGNCYREGKGVFQNLAEAVKWYREAAEQGDADAQNNLGICYENGQGVLQDYTEAAKWYRKAAEQGHVIARRNLMRLLKN